MKTVLFDGTLEFITPCFCAGADQARAEVRAPSIRGELRWWFRALGGSRQEERMLFGGIAGEEDAASALVVRVSDRNPGKAIQLPSGRPLPYLLHYANASDKPRFSAQGMLSPGSTFRLQLLLRRPISSGLDVTFGRSLAAFLRMGTIGYRARRACGAWSGRIESLEDFIRWADSMPEMEFSWVKSNGQPVFCSDWASVMAESEQQLKGMRENYKAVKPSPLGSSSPRQASGVRFRPVRLKEGLLPVMVYTDSALADKSRNPDFHLPA